MDDLNNLYLQYYTDAKSELRRLGCNSYLFKDIYHEAFIILMDKKKNSTVERSYNFTYVITLCKNLWSKERRNPEKVEISEEMELIDEQEGKSNDGLRLLLLKHLENLSSTCREILKLYSKGFNENKIASIMKLGDVKAVKNKKHRCKEKLQTAIEKDPLFDKIYG